jgi:hypothetical protein
MQVHGRYSDGTNYGFMDKMGVWFENFALPVVVNECMMQSYNGTIRLFPNWPLEKDAEFSNLRAAGAFLVSAVLKEGKVTDIKVVSEVGGVLKMILPWQQGATVIGKNGMTKHPDSKVELKMGIGESLTFKPVE